MALKVTGVNFRGLADEHRFCHTCSKHGDLFQLRRLVGKPKNVLSLLRLSADPSGLEESGRLGSVDHDHLRSGELPLTFIGRPGTGKAFAESRQLRLND